MYIYMYIREYSKFFPKNFPKKVEDFSKKATLSTERLPYVHIYVLKNFPKKLPYVHIYVHKGKKTFGQWRSPELSIFATQKATVPLGTKDVYIYVYLGAEQRFRPFLVPKNVMKVVAKDVYVGAEGKGRLSAESRNVVR